MRYQGRTRRIINALFTWYFLDLVITKEHCTELTFYWNTCAQNMLATQVGVQRISGITVHAVQEKKVYDSLLDIEVYIISFEIGPAYIFCFFARNWTCLYIYIYNCWFSWFSLAGFRWCWMNLVSRSFLCTFLLFMHITLFLLYQVMNFVSWFVFVL